MPRFPRRHDRSRLTNVHSQAKQASRRPAANAAEVRVRYSVSPTSPAYSITMAARSAHWSIARQSCQAFLFFFFSAKLSKGLNVALRQRKWTRMLSVLVTARDQIARPSARPPAKPHSLACSADAPRCGVTTTFHGCAQLCAKSPAPFQTHRALPCHLSGNNRVRQKSLDTSRLRAIDDANSFFTLWPVPLHPQYGASYRRARRSVMKSERLKTFWRPPSPPDALPAPATGDQKAITFIFQATLRSACQRS